MSKRSKTYRRPSKTAVKGRTCAAKGCTVILSMYNPTDICTTCLAKIPVGDRAYRYGDGF